MDIQPQISVIIATRNRGASVVTTVRSILENNHFSKKIIVVDQSDLPTTRDALIQFNEDPRLTYVHTPQVGLARAHNLGIKLSDSELIAITDDDCEVPPDWLEQIVAAFNQDEKIGLIFGNTVAIAHDAAKGFIPEFVRTTPRIQYSSWQPSRARGLGACMAVRRSSWEAVGGFDCMMGCGAPLQSGEDADMALRLSLKGYRILETPQVKVLHFGYRTFAEGKQSIYRDAFGVGAALIKSLRSGHLSLLPLFIYEFLWLTLRPVLWNVLRWHRPFQFTMLHGFLAGVKTGIFIPVDHSNGNYRDSGNH